MPSLTQNLTGIFEGAFKALDLPLEHARVQTSATGQDSQFQCNGALACAKPLKKNPREIAQSIIDQIKADNIFAALSIGGPGFINITLTDEYVSSYLYDLSQDDHFGIEKHAGKEEIILDYGGPNIAKPMHVGHLRASIIGDSLRRLYSYAGYHTIGDVHTGDWGTHLGMLFSDYERDDKVAWLLSLDLEDPNNLKILFEDLEERYPKSSSTCKSDETLRAKAKEVTKAMQDHKAPYIDMWKIMHTASLFGMRKNFESLGVHFDEWKGEASVHHLIPQMMEDLKAGDWAIESEGAWVIPVEKNDDKKEMPPLILLKKDGAVLYGTTDLATIVDRMKTHKPSKMIYIVDQRQALHFEQVFRAAYKSGITPENVELTHAGFGTMNGPDGKPFKTRAGGVMKLEDLIKMGIDKATARLDEADLATDMDEAERKDVAHKVAIAALKFADLQNNRIADYVFDIDRMTAFEGKTGPYLLYQAVRIQSLLKKADVSGGVDVPYQIQDADRELALLLGAFPDHFENALKNNTPHVLCDYAYKLAQGFSSFYGNCHILSEKDETLRLSRLKLCQQTHKQLVTILSLLGIRVPDRM